jgi:hypothetical protein
MPYVVPVVKINLEILLVIFAVHAEARFSVTTSVEKSAFEKIKMF